MKRTKLADRELPFYTKGEEIANMVTHIIGGALGIVAIVLCSIKANNAYGVISGIVFGISMLFLYTMSSVYHGLSPKIMGKKVLQVLDHCTIFVLIAGSYTPFALCTLREYSLALGWTIFGIIWVVAALGIYSYSFPHLCINRKHITLLMYFIICCIRRVIRCITHICYVV